MEKSQLDNLIKNDPKKEQFKKEIDGGLRFTEHYVSNDTSKILSPKLNSKLDFS